MPEGIVTVGDVFKISPFENKLVVLELEGKYVTELMQNVASVGGEGISKTVSLKIKDGKVLEAKINGENINPKKTYLVATIDYLAQGNDKMVALAKAKKCHELGITLRDAESEYILKSRVIDASLDDRIVIE